MSQLNEGQIGNKYEQVKDLDKKDIAKLIRKDLKKFSDSKFSVQIRRFTGHGSIDVRLISTDINKRISKRTNELCANYPEINKDFRSEVESIIDQYNFNKSDMMQDYAHVNYWSSFELDGNLTRHLMTKFETKQLR
tara:strand:+ start:55 stop:462 length:408 start_codon:yes stop_codon:yes gene_type:complete